MSTNGISGSNPAVRFAPGLAALAIVGALGVAGLSKVGCANHHTPAGHEGYIKSRPLFGAGAFVGIQEGPTSTGWVWRQEVRNIDVRPRTFSEEMNILTANQLPLTFRAHARIRLRPGQVRDLVEQFGGEDWYTQNVQKQFRSAVRDKVQQLKPFEVKNRMREIGDTVLGDMQKRYGDQPVEFLTVDIGNIQYPDVVMKSVRRKFVTNEDNQRKDIELKIAQKQIEIGIADAQGVADAQRIIRTTLDPMLLQLDALRAIEQLSGSPDTTFVVAPMGKGGTVPIIMNLGQ